MRRAVSACRADTHGPRLPRHCFGRPSARPSSAPAPSRAARLRNHPKRLRLSWRRTRQRTRCRRRQAAGVFRQRRSGRRVPGWRWTMRTALVAALLGSSALLGLAPLPAAAQGQPQVTPDVVPAGQAQAKAAIASCDRLTAYIEQARPAGAVSTDQVRTWLQASDGASCQKELDRLAEANRPAPAAGASPPAPATGTTPPPTASAMPPASPSQAAAPAATATASAAPPADAPPPAGPVSATATGQPVAAGGAAPQVVVQQAQPSVTVRQAQPEIIVRQGPPIITCSSPSPRSSCACRSPT
jgi:hypothetical protein